MPLVVLLVAASQVALLAALLAAPPARAQLDPESVAPQAPLPAKSADAPARRDPYAGRSESEALATLRALEAQLSLGQSPTRAELDDIVAAATSSPQVPVRALAVAVLAWLDPATATTPLLVAWSDEEARVRAGVAQSLLSLARRLGDDDRRRVVAEALAHLDDPSNEVACASVELLGALAPSAAADAVRTRADIADDARYACFARIGGLPLRAVELPPLPEVAAPPADASPPELAPPRPLPDDGTWLLVSTAAAAGLVAGALLPSGFVPSRDVLTYDDDASRITREEVAVASQLGAGLVGAVVLGGSAWAIAQAAPLDVEQAGAVAIATGALGLAGASAQLAFGLGEGPAAFATAGGVALGVVSGAGLAFAAPLNVDDEVLAATSMALGGLGAGLLVFSATPVGLTDIGAAKRVDFGLGVAGMGAGVAGFTALAAGALLDVRAARSATVLAGGVIGGGAATAAGFLLAPASDVESRIACGIGLGGLGLGMVAGMLVPEDWLPSAAAAGPGPALGPAVVVTDGKLRLGIPLLAPVALPGGDGIGATLLYARF